MRKYTLTAATLAATLVFVAGCYLPSSSGGGGGGGGGYVPPAFDPEGTWDGYNDQLVDILAEYTPGTAPSTRAYMDGDFLAEDAQTFFGSATAVDGSPAVLAAADTIRVWYYPSSNTAYVNLSGTSGSPTTNPDFIEVPATRSSFARVQLSPLDGGSYQYRFLDSDGCYYNYRVFLDIRFINSDNLEGTLITRFDWENNFAGADLWNPTCDDFFAAFQDDFDDGIESFRDHGLLYSLVYDTQTLGGAPQPAIDYNNIYFLEALQFNAGFDAERFTRSTSHHDGTSSDHSEVTINRDFIQHAVVNPNALFARLRTPEARARIADLVAKVRREGITDSQGRRVRGPGRTDIETLLSREVSRTLSGRSVALPGDR